MTPSMLIRHKLTPGKIVAMAADISLLDDTALPNPDILGRVIVDNRRGTPLHTQLRKILKDLIDTHFEHGQLFWPEKTIAERLSISRGTVRQALGDLTREGLLSRHHGIGSFVVKTSAPPIALKTVSVFMSHFESEFIKELLVQLAGACRNRRLLLQIYDTHKGELAGEMYRQVEQSPTEKGIILMLESQASLALYSAFADRGYRTVAIEAPTTDYPGPFVETDRSFVTSLSVDHLVGLGHEKIVLFVNEPAASPSVATKIALFNNLIISGKLPKAQIVVCGTRHWENSYDAATAHMEELWALHPTAIITVSDPGAWAALKWFHQNKIDVPGDVSVVGFEDSGPSRYMIPALTTVAHPVAQLAQKAVDMLVSGSTEQIYLAPGLVVRESTAVVRKD